MEPALPGASHAPSKLPYKTFPVLLAGLTKVPIDGQPLSIVQDLEDMCRQYIKVWLSTAPQQCPAAAGIAAAAAAAAASLAVLSAGLALG